jgi:cytochrome c-type biogenesis protein CcmH/NrfG
VNSPKTQELQLRVGASGSVKAWVNDKLMFEEPEERNNGHDSYVFTVKLNKGYNRILFQIGSSEIERLNFSARLTDKQGKPVEGLTFDASYHPYTKETEFESDVIPNQYIQYFEDKINANQDKLLNYILLSEIYSRLDMVEKALETLLKAKEYAPESYFIRTRLLEIYFQRENRTNTAETIEWLRNHDAENIYSLQYMFSEAMQNEDYEKAESLINKMDSLYGKNELYYKSYIEYTSERNEAKKLTEAINDAYKKYPDNETFVYFKYLIYKKVYKSLTGAASLLKKYSKDNYSEDVQKLLASNYFEQGNTNKGFKILEELAENEPATDSYWKLISDQYYELQYYDEAAEYMEKCTDMAPYFAPYKTDLGNIYEQQMKKDKAIKMYKECIEYAPTFYITRKKLQELEGRKYIFEYFEEEDVYELYENAPGSDEYPEDNSVILLRNVQLAVYPEGGSEEKNVLVIKAFDNAAVDNWKEYYISHNPNNQKLIIEKAEVLKANGNKIPAEVNGAHIVFTNLAEGDAIHLNYKKKNYYGSKLLKHFWDKHYMQLFYPVLKDRYSLIVPKDKKFSYKMMNNDTLEPEIKELEENLVRYTWELENIESVKSESYTPALTEYGDVLFVSSLPDWNFVASWYNDLTEGKVKMEFEAKQLLKELFPEDNGLSDKEKVIKIYNHIVNNIRYSSIAFRQSSYVPQDPTKTLNTRLGDCKDLSLLFVTLCREIGLEAELVLNNTRNNGKNDMPLPSISFNHCIAKVTIDGDEYFVELTSDKLPFGALTGSLFNSFNLVINEQNDAPQYLNPDTRKFNTIHRGITVHFENNQMVVKRENYKTGKYAESIRDSYRDLGENRRVKEMTEAISDDFENYLTIDHLEFRNLDTITDTVFYDYSFKVNTPYNKVGSLYLFKLPWANEFEQLDFLSNSERKYPILIWKFDEINRTTENMVVTIPSDKKLFEMPESKTIDSKYATYTIEFTKKGNKLFIEKAVQYKTGHIPVDEYEEFRSFYQKVIESDQQQIAFKEL